MNILNSIRTWWGSGGATAEKPGPQSGLPSTSLIPDLASVGVDAALQISTVWACIDRRASTVASLPFFAYEEKGGEKVLARLSRLYTLLHESPNARMTPFEFWRALVMNHDLRGNGYARIDRDESTGEAMSLWPMPAAQVESRVLPAGSMIYIYRFGNDVAVLDESSVYVLKNLGNGTTGMDKLEFMRAGLDEAAKAQADASKLFGSGGKPAGILMIDRVLKEDQREAIKRNFAEMGEGNISRLHVLEANMNYQQLTMTPEQQQLLETRKYGVEEICRWFDVPPVLIHHSNVTAWGSGIAEIISGFYTFSIRPLLVNIEQGVRKRVMTSRQRVTMAIEFNLDALLRANPKDRAEINARNVQNGLNSRKEIRQLEGWPYIPGTEVLTAQTNLAPLDMLGKIKPTTANGAGAGSDIAQ